MKVTGLVALCLVGLAVVVVLIKEGTESGELRAVSEYATITRSKTIAGEPVVGLQFGRDVPETVLRNLPRFTALELLDCSDTAFSDATATAIRGLKNLKTIKLAQTKLTDRG